jgi:serpin B
VRFANGVWVDAAMRLKAGYAAVVSEHYRSQARPASFKAMASPSPPLSIVAAFSQEFAPMLDSNLSQLICFMPEEARAEINQWFESVTAGRITELVPQGTINSYMVAVLGNAIYFKGAWRSKFDLLHARLRPPRPRGLHVERRAAACRSGYMVLRLPHALGSRGGKSRR